MKSSFYSFFKVTSPRFLSPRNSTSLLGKNKKPKALVLGKDLWRHIFTFANDLDMQDLSLVSKTWKKELILAQKSLHMPFRKLLHLAQQRAGLYGEDEESRLLQRAFSSYPMDLSTVLSLKFQEESFLQECLSVLSSSPKKFDRLLSDVEELPQELASSMATFRRLLSLHEQLERDEVDYGELSLAFAHAKSWHIAFALACGVLDDERREDFLHGLCTLMAREGSVLRAWKQFHDLELSRSSFASFYATQVNILYSCVLQGNVGKITELLKKVAPSKRTSLLLLLSEKLRQKSLIKEAMEIEDMAISQKDPKHCSLLCAYLSQVGRKQEGLEIFQNFLKSLSSLSHEFLHIGKLYERGSMGLAQKFLLSRIDRELQKVELPKKNTLFSLDYRSSSSLLQEDRKIQRRLFHAMDAARIPEGLYRVALTHLQHCSFSLDDLSSQPSKSQLMDGQEFFYMEGSLSRQRSWTVYSQTSSLPST